MMRRISFALALLLCLAAVVSAKQGEPVPMPVIPTLTPTSTALPPTATATSAATLEVTTDRLLFAPQVEIAFPAGVRFYIRVIARAEAIVAASLTLERETQPPQTFDLDLETTATRTGEYTDLTHVWELTPEVYPSFFERIDFRWTVRTAEEVSTSTGRFEFTDARLLWESSQTGDERLSLVMPRQQGIVRLIEIMDAVSTALRMNTGTQQTLNYILYDQSFDPTGCIAGEDEVPYAFTASGSAIRCLDRGLSARVFSASGLAVLRVRSYTQVDMQNALTEAMFDRYYRSLWDGQSVPEWFAFGLMRLYAPTDHSEFQSVAQNASRSNRLFSLAEMATIPEDPAAQRDWQAQSLAMTLYLADRLGFAELFRLARDLTNTEFAVLYPQVTDHPLSALIPSMRDWLFTTRADAAFGVSIYAEATNTPAPSATLTPFPPTRTPRPQPTASLTPTITLTPSPRPTATPTASVTPRPPGSLATATLVAMVPTAPPNDPTAQTSIIAVIGIVIAVLVILFARVRRQ